MSKPTEDSVVSLAIRLHVFMVELLAIINCHYQVELRFGFLLALHKVRQIS